MISITLKPELAEQIEHLAGKEQTSAEALVEKAIRAYIVQTSREKIRRETEAFNEQLESFLVMYPGRYVAIHNGQVIDHDPDLRTLHLRVFDRLGHTPVLLKQVTTEPERELVFRSPRLERNRS